MLQIDMKMPKVCLTEDDWAGNCPMDRLWCAQRFAPKDMTMGEIYKQQTGRVPDWCPWKEIKDADSKAEG